MSIEEEIFNRYLVDKNGLIKYGFEEKNGNKMIYSKSILENAFSIIIEYNGSFHGKVIENVYNEEYINYRLETLGEFSTIIKMEFVSLLNDIRDKCCTKQLFKFEQTRRINSFIYSKYGVKPEFLWEKLPGYCVYRATKKWFGIIGNVQLKKVNKASDSTEEVEILNVKVNENEIGILLLKKGIYMGYHMNKKNWISIILDDTLPDSEIQKLICNSYDKVK